LHREQEVDFRVAQCLLENFFRDDQGNLKQWLFPQLLAVTKQWRKECLRLKDDTFPQMLLWIQFALEAANRIYRAIVDATAGEKVLKPLLYPYDTEGSTCFVDFDTSRPVYATRADRCHISHVVADTESWEQKMAQTLESMDQVVSYFKNQNVGFTIPYTLNGQERNYVPDFVAKLRTFADDVNLIIEVTGEKADRKGSQGRDRANPLGSCREQSRRLRTLGVCGDCRPLGGEVVHSDSRQRHRNGGGRMKHEIDEVGLWSEMKLEIVRDYAKEYSKIVTKQNFTHIYIDAFAGAGVHLSRTTGEYIPGSPLNALMVEPPFKEYHFHRLERRSH